MKSLMINLFFFAILRESRKDYNSLRKPPSRDASMLLKRTTSNKDALFGAYRDAHESKLNCDTQETLEEETIANKDNPSTPKYSYMPSKANCKQTKSSFIEDAIKNFWASPNSIVAPPSNLENSSVPAYSQVPITPSPRLSSHNTEPQPFQKAAQSNANFTSTNDKQLKSQVNKVSHAGGDALPFADDLEASMMSIEASTDKEIRRFPIVNAGPKMSLDFESYRKKNHHPLYSAPNTPGIVGDEFGLEFDISDDEFSEEPSKSSAVTRDTSSDSFDEAEFSNNSVTERIEKDIPIPKVPIFETGPTLKVSNVSFNKGDSRLMAAPLVDENFPIEDECDEILENITRTCTSGDIANDVAPIYVTRANEVTEPHGVTYPKDATGPHYKISLSCPITTNDSAEKFLKHEKNSGDYIETSIDSGYSNSCLIKNSEPRMEIALDETDTDLKEIKEHQVEELGENSGYKDWRLDSAPKSHRPLSWKSSAEATPVCIFSFDYTYSMWLKFLLCLEGKIFTMFTSFSGLDELNVIIYLLKVIRYKLYHIMEF